MLSRPLRRALGVLRRIPMIFRIAPVALALLAIFNISSSLASPVTVTAT